MVHSERDLTAISNSKHHIQSHYEEVQTSQSVFKHTLLRAHSTFLMPVRARATSGTMRWRNTY